MRALAFFSLFFLLFLSRIIAYADDTISVEHTVKLGQKKFRFQYEKDAVTKHTKKVTISNSEYRDTFADLYGHGVFDTRLLDIKNTEYHFFNLYRGHFKNLEISMRGKKGILHVLLYYQPKKRKYVVLERGYEKYHRLSRDDLSIDSCQAAPSATSINTNDWSQILSLANEDQMADEIKKLNVIDASCQTGKFAASYENIVHGMARVMATSESNSNSFLSCLDKNKMGDLSFAFEQKFAEMADNKKIAKIHCGDVPSDSKDPDSVTGSYAQDTDTVSINAAIHSGNDENDRQTFARIFFHESIHRVGIESEERTHAIEDCCSNVFDPSNSTCKNMNELTDDEHKLVSFATAFSEKLDGFTDYWKNLTKNQDPDISKRMFSYFVDQMVQRHNDVKAQLDACPKTATGDIEPSCHNQIAVKAIQDSVDSMQTVCTTYFRDLPAEKCEQHKKDFVALMVKNIKAPCTSDDGTSVPCIREAVDEGIELTASTDPKYTENFENLAISKSIDSNNYYVSLLTAIHNADPNFATFLTKMSADLGEDTNQNITFHLLDFLMKKEDDLGVLKSFDACITKAGANQKDCSKVAMGKFASTEKAFFEKLCPFYLASDDPQGDCGAYKKSFDTLFSNNSENDFRRIYGIFQNADKIAKNFDQEKNLYDPFSSAVKTDPSEIEISYLTAMDKDLKGFKEFYLKVETALEPDVARKMIYRYIDFIRASEMMGKGSLAAYEECSQDDSKKMTDCNQQALTKFTANMKRFFDTRCPDFFVDQNPKEKCDTYYNSTLAFINQTILSCSDSSQYSDKKSYKCIADFLNDANGILKNFKNEKVFDPNIDPRIMLSDADKESLNNNKDGYSVDTSAKPIASVPIDPKNDKQSQVAAADSYSSANEASRIGSGLANSAGDAMENEAYADSGDDVVHDTFNQATTFAPDPTNNYENSGDTNADTSVSASNTQNYGPRTNSAYNSGQSQAWTTPLAVPNSSQGQDTAANFANTSGASALPNTFPESAPAATASAGGVGAGANTEAPAASTPAVQPSSSLNTANTNNKNSDADQRLKNIAANKSSQTGVTRAPAAVDAAMDMSPDEIIIMAKEHPQDLIAHLSKDSFLQTLQAHKILVLFHDRSFGSLDSDLILKYDAPSATFSVVRLTGAQ